MNLAMGNYDGASKIAMGMNSAVSQYDKDRKKFKEEGFLQHMFSPQALERSNVPSNIEMRSLPSSQPTKEQLTVESTQKNIPSQQPMAGPELSYSSPIQNMDNDMLTDYSKRLQRMYG